MKFFTITTLLSLFLCSALAQSSPLDKKITISLVEVTLPEALNKISKAGDFSFSYNSSLISDEQIVTLYAIDRTVGSILTDLFKGTVSFKAKGRYIILKKVALTPKPSQFVIAGFVEDEGTGEKLKDASLRQGTHQFSVDG
jgi:hypothetical protein